MSCEACEDMREKDGVTPDCEAGRGCMVPPPGPDGARVLQMRARLVLLRDLLGPGAVLEAYGATREDVELLAAVEEELRRDAEEEV